MSAEAQVVDLAHWSTLKETRVACVELATCLSLLPGPRVQERRREEM